MSFQAPRVETRTELGTYQTMPTALDLVIIKHLFPLVRQNLPHNEVKATLLAQVARREGCSVEDYGEVRSITELLLILAELDGHATN